MSLNVRCLYICLAPLTVFEAIKPHRTFNSCKGCLYNQDLYELSEEEILALCPDSVYNISKVNGNRNMIIFTFSGSFLPVRVKVGRLSMKLKPFIERPLQCYSCYGYGHGRKTCKETPRCGNCSALDSHPTSACESSPYCFHCQNGHAVQSRQCSRYRLEQDIL